MSFANKIFKDSDFLTFSSFFIFSNDFVWECFLEITEEIIENFPPKKNESEKHSIGSYLEKKSKK